MEKREAYTGVNRRLEEVFSGGNPGKPWSQEHLQDFRAAVEILSGVIRFWWMNGGCPPSW